MKVKARLDKASEKRVRAMLDSMEKVFGVQTEEGIGIIGFYTGLRLAHKIQPFGFSKMGGTEASVGKQVWRAAKNAQLEGSNQTVSSAHQSRRNRKGQVPKTLQTLGRYKRKPYTVEEIQQQAAEKAANVGLAKASWVEAAEKIGIGGIPTPEVVQRHTKKGNGRAIFSRMLLRTRLEIESKISYIRALLKDSVVTNALIAGRKNALKYMEKNVTRALRQMEREQKRAQKQYEKFNKRAARFYALKTTI